MAPRRIARLPLCPFDSLSNHRLVCRLPLSDGPALTAPPLDSQFEIFNLLLFCVSAVRCGGEAPSRLVSCLPANSLGWGRSTLPVSEKPSLLYQTQQCDPCFITLFLKLIIYCIYLFIFYLFIVMLSHERDVRCNSYLALTWTACSFLSLSVIPSSPCNC